MDDFEKERKECENNFIRNGSLLQEQLIAFCNGKNLPIHVFSAKQVMKMSNFLDGQIIKDSGRFRLYCGTIDEGNRTVCIKFFYNICTFIGVEGIAREIVIATQMSLNQNSLKLIGCCLETEFPVLVYEFPDKGCLGGCIYREEGSLPWKCRLKIGLEISYALAYLQNGFGRPVIFRDLHLGHVFLDKDYAAKLTGFYFSVLIPEGEVHLIDAVVGTGGGFSSAAEYMNSGRLTEKTDVYSFGVLLFELLVGHDRYDNGMYRFQLLTKIRDHGRSISMIVDPALSREIEENGKQQKFHDVYELVLRCTVTNEDDRPSMIDVASELKKISDSI